MRVMCDSGVSGFARGWTVWGYDFWVVGASLDDGIEEVAATLLV